jgi:hypothetical protein
MEKSLKGQYLKMLAQQVDAPEPGIKIYVP